MEEWKIVPGTEEKIEVSSEGRVRSMLRGEPFLLKTQKDSKGYHRISITISRKKKTFKLHRIVAQAFIDNPYKLPQINHIDGNKDNNKVSNLEWISNRDNAQHAIKNGLWESVIEGVSMENERRKRKVIGISESECKEFESIAEAERYVGSRHVVDVLKGRREHVKGWSFTYKEGGDL